MCPCGILHKKGRGKGKEKKGKEISQSISGPFWTTHRISVIRRSVSFQVVLFPVPITPRISTRFFLSVFTILLRSKIAASRSGMPKRRQRSFQGPFFSLLARMLSHWLLSAVLLVTTEKRDAGSTVVFQAAARQESRNTILLGSDLMATTLLDAITATSL